MNELHKAFDHLNEHIFDGRLPRVEFRVALEQEAVFVLSERTVITIGRLFHLASGRDVLDHLLHCMVQIDTVLINDLLEWKSADYCNTWFKPAALRAGLNLVRHNRRGWAISTSRRVCQCIHAGHCAEEQCAEEQCVDCNTRTAPAWAIRRRRIAYEGARLRRQVLDALWEQLTTPVVV